MPMVITMGFFVGAARTRGPGIRRGGLRTLSLGIGVLPPVISRCVSYSACKNIFTQNGLSRGSTLLRGLDDPILVGHTAILCKRNVCALLSWLACTTYSDGKTFCSE